MKMVINLLCSFALCMAVVGCGKSEEASQTATPEASVGSKEEHGHDHDHDHGAGPHGGTIVEWGGGDYHLEFTVDHDKQEATVYVLDGSAKSAAPIKAERLQLVIHDPETEIELVAQPQEGEPAGSSSRFVGTHETIGIVKPFAGTITGEVDGTPYVGEFKEEEHGADHKH